MLPGIVLRRLFRFPRQIILRQFFPDGVKFTFFVPITKKDLDFSRKMKNWKYICSGFIFLR